MLDISNGVQTVSAAGPLASVSVSQISGDWTAFSEVVSLTAGMNAHFQIEQSIDGFTTSQPVLEVDTAGAVSKEADKVCSVRKYELAGNDYIGVLNARLRVNVLSIDPGCTLAVRAWLTTP